MKKRMSMLAFSLAVLLGACDWDAWTPAKVRDVVNCVRTRNDPPRVGEPFPRGCVVYVPEEP